MATTFRVCTAGDLPVFTASLGERSLGSSRPGMPSPLERFLADPTLGLSWLIERGGEAVGYLVLSYAAPEGRSTRRAYVSGLYLRPDHRGKGIGATALRLADEVGRTFGFQVLAPAGVAAENKLLGGIGGGAARGPGLEVFGSRRDAA